MISTSQWEKLFILRDSFVKKYTGLEFYKYQRKPSDKIIKSIILNDGETIIIEFSRQSGKTEDIVDTIVFLCAFYFEMVQRFAIHHSNFFNIGIFAPQKQQAETDFIRLKERLKAMKEEFGITFEASNGNTLKLNNGCTIFCFSGSPTSHTESKTLHVIIYEEAQDMLDFVIDKTIAPMGAATNATEIFIGSGGYQKCRFWQHIEKKVYPTFIYDWRKVVKEKKEAYNRDKNPLHLNYQKHVDKRKRDIGEDSDEFKTQYELKWILERGQFITYSNLMKLEDNYVPPVQLMKHKQCYGGIDWGKVNDSTTFTIVDDRCRIIYWLEMQGDDYNSQIESIVDLIKHRFPGMVKLHCDKTAQQDMAIDVLKARLIEENLSIWVEGVPFTVQSKDQMYKNASRLMHDKIKDGQVIEPAQLKFSTGFSIEKERFIKQFLELQKDVRGNRWVCEHPKGPNYHDDYCDSLALTLLSFKVNRPKQDISWDIF